MGSVYFFKVKRKRICNFERESCSPYPRSAGANTRRACCEISGKCQKERAYEIMEKNDFDAADGCNAVRAGGSIRLRG